MLDYVLFAEQLRDRFTEWLNNNGVVYRTDGDGDELLVLIDEDLDEDVQDRIDEQYDLLLEESARIADEEDDSPDAVHLVGIQFQRSDGRVGHGAHHARTGEPSASMPGHGRVAGLRAIGGRCRGESGQQAAVQALMPEVILRMCQNTFPAYIR